VATGTPLDDASRPRSLPLIALQHWIESRVRLALGGASFDDMHSLLGAVSILDLHNGSCEDSAP